MKPLFVCSGPLLLLSFLAAACTSRQSGGPPPATGGNGSSWEEDGRGDRPRSHLPFQKADSSTSGGTGHHFQARPHEPHLARLPAPPPHPGVLPRFVDGSYSCFPAPVVQPPVYYPSPSPRYVAPPTSGSGTYSGGYGQGYGRGVQGGGHSKPSASPSAAPRAEATTKSSGARRKPASPPHDASAGSAEGHAEFDRERRRHSSDDGAAPWRDDDVAPWRDESGFGAAVYLSNDDTMSLSSAQRLIYAIDQYAPLSPSEVRPHELLNYFSFATEPVATDHDFSVLASIAPSTEGPEKWALGFSVQGRPLSKQTRRSANLSYVVDRSGSMAAEGRMEYVKRGMLRSLRELKQGDIVNITLFDTNTCRLAQNFVVGRDPMHHLESLIQRIEPRGSTNLHDGLALGYEAANSSYQPTYTNRVVMITDALTNTGVTDERLISMVGKHFDDRKIRLSGVGVGREFNDSLLDRLTERGKGAYVFLGSSAEVDAVFGERFVSLIETIADDVHFKLSLPPSLRLATFYGEEASTVKERVQAIHYFAGTAQMFLSDVQGRDARFPGTDDIMLTIEYTDPESGRARVEEFAWNLGDIYGRSQNTEKATLVSTFARRLQLVAGRPLPSQYGHVAHSWYDEEAARVCEHTGRELRQLALPVGSDPEAGRIVSLWENFCARYRPIEVAHHVPDEPRAPYGDPRDQERPLRTNEYAPPASWPSAVR